MISVFVAATVREGVAVVPLGVIKPTQLLFSAVVTIRRLEALHNWETCGVLELFF